MMLTGRDRKPYRDGRAFADPGYEADRAAAHRCNFSRDVEPESETADATPALDAFETRPGSG
jgi:hypothetical protein